MLKALVKKDNICLDQNEYTYGALVDLQKASDRIKHQALIARLHG